MTRIILIRHGETDWNKEQVFRGRIDVPLNSVGLEQAKVTGEALRNYRIDAIYSSPLSRAMKTAEAVAAFHPDISVKEAEGFIDIDFGKWQGIPHNRVQEEYRELYNKWEREPDIVKMPDGESLDDVKLRSMGALNNIFVNHDNKTVAIASHRVVNKVILCSVLGLTNQHFWAIRQDTCSINIFDTSARGFIISVINDTCHIKALADNSSKADF
ncbi:MAG: histidine phosphatase family protein [Pseudomonadota bacterium]